MGLFKTVKKFLVYLIERLLRPRWIVGTCPGSTWYRDLGLRFLGIHFWYYKWPDPMIEIGKKDPYRVMLKREFGESIKSQQELEQ